MNILLRGGIVVSSKSSKRADVLISGEKIIAIGKNLKTDAEVVDVTSKLLFPGFIDAHTHFDLEVSDTVTADDFEFGTKSAIAGGTTTIIDFATQNKGENLSCALNNWHVKAFSNSSCDYAFHMSISDWNNDVKNELPAMFEQGVTSFKVYMTYPLMKLCDKEIFDVLTELKNLGGIAGVHCENAGIIDGLVEGQRSLNQLTVSSHPLTRPDYAEAEAVNRLLNIAYAVDTPVIIVHLSTKAAFDEVMRARARGQKVYVETCPQYLLLDEEKYKLDFLESSKYVCSPPVRKAVDRKSLWHALKREEIQIVSTDHCSFTTEQKGAGESDFTKVPNGMPGVETRGFLMYTYGVRKKRISLSQMCAYLSENPAKLYGMYPKKGAIKVGSDADIVIYDPRVKQVIKAENMHGKCDYSPFENVKVDGKIDGVYLRGHKVFDGKNIINEKIGRYVSRSKFEL